MIEMAVCYQQPIELSKTQTGSQYLPLSAFPTVKQESVLVMLNDLSWQTTVGRRR
jgi:hypothetical protein